MSGALRLGMTSLEPWDDVWRRNQHLASRLVGNGTAASLIFVEPPRGGLAVRARRRSPLPGIEVVTPPLLVPRRYGGHRLVARWLRRVLTGVELLWINDPVAGVGALRDGVPAVYDVTDDWRKMPQSMAERARTVAAEDVLARHARTVVCSDVLAQRWTDRYGVLPAVVHNGVDVAAISNARPTTPAGPAPHAVYVGTLHENRIDIDLVLELARAWPGTVHLVGPDHLDPKSGARLAGAGVHLPGPVPSGEVAGWLVAAEVLIAPHLVDDFTLSLDAIKSHEYLATDRPVVATPSSGFQALPATPGLTVAERAAFVEATVAAEGTGPFARTVAIDWDQRAVQFAAELTAEFAAAGRP
jgi:glycosyltransferase involved in cell wall biosynthesis